MALSKGTPMRRGMTVFQLLETILKYVIFLFMAFIVVLVFSNVISRYFLGAAIAWSEEISRFLLIWMAFFGTILAYIRDEHLGLDLVVKKLPPRAAAAVGIVAHLLIAYALWLIINGGYDLAMRSMDWLSPATSTSYGLIYLVVPVTCAVMVLQTAFKIARFVKQLLRGNAEDTKEGVSC